MKRDFEIHDHPLKPLQVLLPLRPWTDEMTRRVKSDPSLGIRISIMHGLFDESVEFLRSFETLPVIDLYSHVVKDIDPVLEHTEIRGLGLEWAGNRKIDFMSFQNLQYLAVDMPRGTEHIQLPPSLEILMLCAFRGVDLADFGALPELTRMRLWARQLRSLEGLSPQNKLEWCELMDLRSLPHIGGIEVLSKVKHLYLRGCKSIGAIDSLGALQDVKYIMFDNVGDIDSLAPLVACPKLKKVCLLGRVNVLDGRISVVHGIPALEECILRQRRHYDMDVMTLR